MSFNPVYNRIDRIEGRTVADGGPLDYDGFDTKRAGGVDLRSGRAAATVFRDEDVNALIAHQVDFIFDIKWPACENQSARRKQVDSVRWFYRSHYVMVLRCVGKHRELQSADGQKNASWVVAKCPYRSFHVGHNGPPVGVNRPPRRPGENRERPPEIAT